MAIVYRVAKGSPLTNAEVDGNFSELDTLKANKTTTVTGTNGLTGGGDLSANRTLALGTPSTLTVSSTNSASGTTHTHALNLSGRQIIAGNGLVGGGDLGSDRTLSIGTPSDPISVSSTNSVSSNSHNHRLDLSGRIITSGDGLTGGGNLSADRTLSVDSSVVRTYGNQTISGTKTFQSIQNTGNIQSLTFTAIGTGSGYWGNGANLTNLNAFNMWLSGTPFVQQQMNITLGSGFGTNKINVQRIGNTVTVTMVPTNSGGTINTTSSKTFHVSDAVIPSWARPVGSGGLYFASRNNSYQVNTTGVLMAYISNQVATSYVDASSFTYIV